MEYSLIVIIDRDKSFEDKDIADIKTDVESLISENYNSDVVLCELNPENTDKPDTKKTLEERFTELEKSQKDLLIRQIGHEARIKTLESKCKLLK